MPKAAKARRIEAHTSAPHPGNSVLNVSVRNRRPPEADGLILLGLALTVNAILLWPELRIERVPVNDLTFHIVSSQRFAESLFRGNWSLDPWMSQWALGYPLWHFYQPLPHVVAGVWLALTNRFASPTASFAVLYYLLMVALPASTYIGARLFGFEPRAAGFASILILSVSEVGDFSRYGLSYGAYVRRGSGLYTQLFSYDLFIPALGLASYSLNTGRRRIVAACLIAATALSHVVFGYAAIVSVGIIAIVGPRRGRSRRVVRAASIVIPALILIAWFVIPMLLSSGEANRCRWDDTWKFDSWGALVIFQSLVSGDLFDYGRVPVMSLAIALAAVFALLKSKRPMARRVLVLTIAWLAIFFGRTTWGYLMALLGLPVNFHISRFESVFELFAAMMTAWALAKIVASARRIGLAATVAVWVAIGVAAFIIFSERANYLHWNNVWGDQSLAAIAKQRPDLNAAFDDIRAIVRERPGRVWSGPTGMWASKFKIAEAQPYSFLSLADFDELSFLYHSLSWSSDVSAEINEQDPYQVKLFAMRAALAPTSQPMPPEFRRRGVHGDLAVYEASNEGYFGLADIGARYDGPLGSVLNRDFEWMQNRAVRAGSMVALGGDLRGVPEWKIFEALPPLDPKFSTPRGEVVTETNDGEAYSARVAILRPCYALLRITYFPGQQATVDGKRTRIYRVYPNFCAIPVAVGEHTVVVRYRPGPIKPILLIAGIVLVGSIAQGMRCRDFAALEQHLTSRLAEIVSAWDTPHTRVALALTILIMLFAHALLTGKLIDGHDSLEYPPRLIEFAKVVGEHQLPPVWAPDLGAGHGQPLFEFAPPLIYATAFPLFELGFSLANSLQFAMVILFAFGALAVFMIGRKLSFSQTSSIAAGAAWLFAPYQTLDIFVCARFAESSAIAVAPIALLGLLNALQRPTVINVALGSFAVALVALAHNAIALLMFPAFAALVAVRAAASDDRTKVGAAGVAVIMVGLGLSAFFWMPALMEKDLVKTGLLLVGEMRWTNYIIHPWQLIWSPWGWGYASRGPTNGISYSLGVGHLALAIGGFVIAMRAANRMWRLDAIVFAAAATIGALLATDLSWAVWERVGTLQYLVYPWRMLCLPALFMPLLALYAFERLGSHLTAFAIVTIILINIAHTAPKGIETYDDAYYYPDSIAERGINTSTREEYEPRTVLYRPSFDAARLKGVLSTPAVSQLAINSSSQSFEVDTRERALMQDSIFDYPGWTVLVDDREVAIAPALISGQITFSVPAGSHRVVVELRSTPVRKWSLYMSLATCLTLIMMCTYCIVRNRSVAVDQTRAKKPGKAQSRGTRRSAAHI
jgi:hypothetical protein